MKNEVRAALVALVSMGLGCSGEVGGLLSDERLNEAAAAGEVPLLHGPRGGPMLMGYAPARREGVETLDPRETAGPTPTSPQGAGGGTAAPVAFTPGPSGCAPMSLESGVSVGGFISDRYHWSDSGCRPRSAALVRNNGADPGGSYGGYLRELTYERAGTTLTARGTGVNGYNGWGYVVNHYASSSDSSKRHSGTYRTVLAGQHHAIHEFKVRNDPGGPLDATVRWFFASGRSSPVYFITYDASAAGPNVVAADSRAPYGDLAFEGTSGPIGGVAWGDKYRFTTTGTGPVLPSSAWDYTQANTIPFVRMWSQNVDAEMGSVQTQTWESQPAGGDYGAGKLGANCWGHTSANKGVACSANGWNMPTDWLWPYQLNNYEIDNTTSSHRVAWGTTYGAIGKTSYSAFGKTLSGYPTVSYSVLMTVGPKSSSAVMAQVTQVERLVGAQVSAPAVYEASYAVWRVPMTGNAATVTMTAAAGPVTAPIFQLTGFTGTALSHVTLDGRETSSYFATVDAATQTVWLTLNGTVTGAVSIHVE